MMEPWACGVEGDCAEAQPDPAAITCDTDLRLTWGELDEWLGRS